MSSIGLQKNIGSRIIFEEDILMLELKTNWQLKERTYQLEAQEKEYTVSFE